MSSPDAPSSSPSFSRRKWLGLVSPPALAATFGASLARGESAGGRDPERDRGVRAFNIRDFGAVGDGKTLDTRAVQAAIDACAADAGGRVLVPAGTFLIGTVELKSNITLHVAAGGTLLGSRDGKDYHAVEAIPLHGDTTLEDGDWALIFAVGATNITIEGPGLIDGQGEAFHAAHRGETPPSGIGGNRRPYLLLFYRCRNLVVRDIDLFRSGYHMVRVIESSYVRMDGLHIHNRVSGNNDGFHFISAEHVAVSNCFVESQDDACALFGSCRFVTITNCAFSTRWSVFRFGGGVVRNIAVSNCLLYEVFGCPIKFFGRPGDVFEDLSFSNLVLQHVTGPIHLSIGPSYRRYAAGPPPVVRNLSFSNIHGTVTTDPGQLPGLTFPQTYNPGERFSCIALNCVGDSVMENISFDNIHLTFGGGGTAEMGARRELPNEAGEYFRLGPLPAYGFYARNARGLTLNNLRFQVKTPELRPAIVLDGVSDVAVSGLAVEGNPKAESTLRFQNVQDALIDSPRVLVPSSTFLRAEGARSANVIIDGGDLSKASAPLALEGGAAATSVRLRGQ